MHNKFTYIPYNETGYFSKLVIDYLCSCPAIQPFYQFEPDTQGIANAIKERYKYPVDRKNLVDTLARQYADLTPSPNTTKNIQLLLDENTFTVCTAHQPNLMTGYLYFIYKILHTIKLADELNGLHPGNHFVPVYYMGSEDNDLEELGTFRFNNEKYIWDGDGQKGAVGRMDPVGLKKLLNELFMSFGPPGTNCDNLQHIISAAYLQHTTIGKATQYIVNELFGSYGLIILDPDDTALKANFIRVMEDELLHQTAFPAITQQINRLSEHYKIQAHPRSINLFYLNDQLRERIENHGDKWVVLNTEIQWEQEELIKELKEHPERFSPNVMLRGLYQETLLPNIAFIGGGAEVAYWMQLKTIFEHYKVFYPNILLRQSVLWVNEERTTLRGKLGFSVMDLFKDESHLIREFISQNSGQDWQTESESAAIEHIFSELEIKATKVDPTLQAAAKAALTKMKRQLVALEKKMLRAEKRKMDTQVLRIKKLKAGIFPNNSLQERVENFMEYYLQYGLSFFDTLYDGIKPLKKEFLVVE